MSAASLAILFVIASGVAIRFVAAGGAIGPDQSWHDLMATLRTQFADSLARVLNAVGGTLDVTTVVVVLAIVLLARREWRVGVSLVASILISLIAFNALKAVVGRARPLDALVAAGGDSFPSGHSTMAAALAVGIALIVRRVWVWVLAIVWGVLMAWSRTYLLVHWLSDTVAGVVLGASISVVVFWSVHRISRGGRMERPAHSFEHAGHSGP
ncbi:phosphatase PAP2 family protein [Naasia lichenicola]|uniref:phosphatase PAP2 family protein n=1 Tax=Naasia lichenicola TaxID=2565933 RepID=UPI001E392AEE|nr:phosphatase PAP2 family protein [Naasia lichenicola]